MPQRILLCDDDLYILRAAEFKFQRAGYEVACAGHGEEAWREIQRQRPDILIADCQMPQLDGLGLVRRIRATPEIADLPIIMLTAKGFELSRDEVCGQLGVAMIVGKPFSPRALLRSVDEILNSPPRKQWPAVLVAD